jgi:outer membrane protein OmpA-like peptidoglycan-associated protein
LLTYTLPEPLRAQASVVVKGELSRDAALEGREVAIQLRYAQSREVQTIEVKGDGSFAAVVDLSRYEDVLLTTVAEGAVFSAALVVDRDEPAPEWVEADVELKSVEAGEPFEIQNIHFPTASALIGRASRAILDLFAEYLMDSGFRVEIQGHTDDVGGETENLELSRERARAVRTYLHNNGVSQGRIESKGFGEEKPRADNGTADGRAKNRRTTFVILPNK